MKKTLLYTFIVVIGLSSCKNKSTGRVNSNAQYEINENVSFNEEYKERELTLAEFLIWCSDTRNNINKSKEVSEIRYNLLYMPTETMAHLELRRQKYDYKQFRTICDGYKNMIYFNFKIELASGNGELLKYGLQESSQYDKRIKYISFEMQKDIYAVQGIDTVYPDLYQFERVFNVAPYSTVMIAFDSKKIDNSKELDIIYNDRLFEKGFIKFNYKNGQLINIPNVTGL